MKIQNGIIYKKNGVKKMKNYFEINVLSDLLKKGCLLDLKIQKRLIIKRGILGIKSLGKLDFLVNYCGYYYKMID